MRPERVENMEEEGGAGKFCYLVKKTGHMQSLDIHSVVNDHGEVDTVLYF